MSKDVRITIEEVLLGFFVVEKLAFIGSKKSIRISLDGVSPRFKSAATDVDDKLLVFSFPSILGYRRRRQRVIGKRNPSNGSCSSKR